MATLGMSQSTCSELSNVEVTHDEFRLIAKESDEPAQVRSGKPFRLSNILNGKHLRPKRSPPRRTTEASVRSDYATTRSLDGLDGQQSVANFTVGSHDTVKASNRKNVEVEPSSSEPVKKPKKAWMKIKRLMGVKSDVAAAAKQESDDGSDPRNVFSRTRTQSAGHVTPNRSNPKTYPLENRTGSDPRHQKKARSPEAQRRSPPSKEQAHLDQAIRGRLDGMDVISLGSARQLSSTPDPIPPPPNDDDILMHPFTGVSNKYSPRQMIFDMIWTSGGKSPPEFVFEGFLPGGEDRWKVILDAPRSDYFTSQGRSNNSASKEQHSDSQPEDDGGTFIPLDKIWKNLWGSEEPPPPSTHMSPSSGKEDILQLASSCSVPIDLDEDTFIIETALHLQAVHDIAALSIRCGRLEEALAIFNKVLRGLELKHKTKPHYLVGSALHNIGLILLYEGSFGHSFLAFQRAVTIRRSSLPADHPDISVSLMREGMALFALERFDDALVSFEAALLGLPQENATRAKVLNNIGVVQYKRQDFIEALKAFTSALAIQRFWLDGPVRRDSIVYDASITLGNMGKLYLERFDYEMSFYVFEESLLLQTTVFPKDHEVVLASLGNLAFAKAKNAEYKKALQIYNSIQRSQTTKFGPESCEVIETTGLMGVLHWRHYDHDEALKCLTTVLTWQKTHLKASNPALRRTKELIRKIVEAVQGEASVWI